MRRYNVAIFASGNGSNALKIMEYFTGHNQVAVALVITNRKEAGVLQHAQSHNIPAAYVATSTFAERPQHVLDILSRYQIDFIVLAGFLLKIPQLIVQDFSGRMLNIHPAILPDFGGKGMYGDRVHQAVHDAKRTESGITIHYVNSEYDKGDILFQARVAIDEGDGVADIRNKVQQLEYAWFPKIISSAVAKIANDEN